MSKIYSLHFRTKLATTKNCRKLVAASLLTATYFQALESFKLLQVSRQRRYLKYYHKVFVSFVFL